MRCAAALSVALFATSAGAIAEGSALLARMGSIVPTIAAVRRDVAFVPFVPARRIVGVALLPPFRGDDSRRTRGIGYAYDDGTGRRYVLAQWPRNGGTIDGFLPFAGDTAGCADVRTFSRGTTPRGIVWSTPHGIVLTLQADGANDARTLEIEWKKLIRRGACR
jgi:hypothetical protein